MPKPTAPAQTRPAKTEISPIATTVPKPGRNSRKNADPAKIREAEVEHAPAVHTESRTGIVKLPSVLSSAAYLDFCNSTIKIVSKTGITMGNLVSHGYVKNALSTGCLMFDFTCGGGIAPGRFTVIPGREGSGKSTLTDLLAATCVLQGTPIFWNDAENAFSPDYASKIFSKLHLRFSDLLGVLNTKTGKYDVAPAIFYSPDSIGERVFKTMREFMLGLPTIKQGADGTYWKLIDNKGKKSWLEDEREGKSQFLFINDSLPALLPESISDDPDKNPMAVQARMFASMMQLVKGLLGEKNCTFVATNQLRMAPGVTHGDPIYEPAGQAIQFYSDNRTRIMRVSPNTAGVPSGSGAKFSTEPGLRGGKDQYVYSKIVNTKNKAFPPFRESMLRIRFLKDGSPGDGICETWDCASYLQATGQMVQRGQTITMNLMPVKAKGRQIDIFEQGERTTYPKFKEMVEDPKYKRMIWKHCFHQMQGGYGFDLEREAAARLIAKASRESVLEEPAGIDA